MNETVCSCGTPTRDDAYVCDGCLNSLTRVLAETPWLAGELETTIAGQRGVDYAAMGGSPSSEKPTPVNVPALEARRAYRHALAMCVRFCEEEGVRHQAPTSRQPVDSLESMSRWLMWRVDGLAFNDMAYEFVRDITDAAKACKRTVDRKPERRYAGPCECGRDLYHKPGATEVKCRECERVYQVGELYAWMRQGVLGRLVTAREGSTLLGTFDLPTSASTIDKWHARKRIVDHGENAQKRRLYLIDDLLDLAARNATKTS
jgi:hypothetical protein